MKRNLIDKDNPILRQIAEKVTNAELKELNLETGLIGDMIDTMLRHDAVGLAAPQIGISKRIIVTIEPHDKSAIVLINPEVLKESESTSSMEEGCLSCGATQVKIKRAKHIKVRSTKLDGTTEINKFRGLLARQILHEVDHLDGRLIIDYEN